MHTGRLYSVFKIIVSLMVVAVALAFSAGLAQNLREIRGFWPIAPSTGIVRLLGAVVLFVVVVFVLRLTRIT